MFGEDVEQKLLGHCRERWKKLLVQCLPMAFWQLVNPIGLQDVSETAALQRIKQFIDQNELANRKLTHVAQKKKTTKEEIEDFALHISWKKDVQGIVNDDAGFNADLTNVHFSPHFERTVAQKGTKDHCHC